MPLGSETARVSHRLVESSREVIGDVTTRRLAIFAAVAAVLLLLLVLGGGSFFPSRGLDPTPERPAADATAGVEPAGRAGAKPGDPAKPDEGDETAMPPDESDEPVAGEREPAGPPDGFFPGFHGTVVDMDTGEPIAGVRVEYGPEAGSSWGAHTKDDGTFRFFDPISAPEHPDPKRPSTVRIYTPGYETLEVVPREEVAKLELRPRTGPPVYGRIRGRAEDGAGRPLPGALSVRVTADEGRSEYLTVLADENGAFTLEALDPGGCRLSLERGPTVSVFVPEGGEVEVVVRAREDIDASRRPEFGEEEIAELRHLGSERSNLDIRLRGLGNQPPLEGGERDLALARLGRIQARARQLRTAAILNPRPRAPVTITGLGDADGARLVAEGFDYEGSNERWWALVRDGKARFPGFFVGEWRLTLVTRDGERKSTIRIERDDAPVTVRFDGD